MRVINLEMLKKNQASDKEVVLIDVSSTQEFVPGSIDGAVNIPLAILSFVIEERYPNKKGLYYLTGSL